jgi:hypothetical protein
LLAGAQAGAQFYFYAELPTLDEAKTCDRKAEVDVYVALLDQLRDQAAFYQDAVEGRIEDQGWDCVPDPVPVPVPLPEG